MSVARFGDTLVTQQLAGVSLPDTVYVGCSCARCRGVVEQATFSNVRITLPAADYVSLSGYLIERSSRCRDRATSCTTTADRFRQLDA
jgi:hypothetical protein